jgi:hypothetical protein
MNRRDELQQRTHQAEDGSAIHGVRYTLLVQENLRNVSESWPLDLPQLRPGEYHRFVDSMMAEKDNLPS